MYQLRPEYQEPAHIATIEHCRASTEPAFHNMSVGAGKTINIAFMCKHVTDKGGKVLVLARQGELIEQNANDAWAIGVKTSIFSASLGKKSTVFNCVMGTEGTVSNHLGDVFSNWLPDCILIDEAHMVPFDDDETQYMKIINHFKALRPKLRIIGYTGSPYRGSASILGPFWKKQLSDVGTMQLISMGFLVPPVFGFGDDEHHYDLSEFKPSGVDGAQQDFTAKELAAMSRKLTKDSTMTQIIMEQVQDVAKTRGGVLITCASKKHCEQVAECLPAGTWGIVTDDTSTKKRREILEKAKRLEIKYVIQIGCLTTGVNIPVWDVCVILRKIGSLTLLIQLIGRVLRQLKPEQVQSGMIKNDALVLDYTDTLESMGDIYDDPIVQQALAQKKAQTADVIECPKCATMNSKTARRCRGIDSKGERCDHFWQFVECKNCGAQNDIAAKECRCCEAVMIDPNTKLLGKAYTDADFKPVKSWEVKPVKGDGVMIRYHLDSTHTVNGEELPEVATEFLNPFHTAPHVRNMWIRWVVAHAPMPHEKSTIMRPRTAAEICQAILQVAEMPQAITHRINQKGYSVINRKKFSTSNEIAENAS